MRNPKIGQTVKNRTQFCEIFVKTIGSFFTLYLTLSRVWLFGGKNTLHSDGNYRVIFLFSKNRVFFPRKSHTLTITCTSTADHRCVIISNCNQIKNIPFASRPYRHSYLVTPATGLSGNLFSKFIWTKSQVNLFQNTSIKWKILIFVINC